ncbi:TonB-dependent siderophore receptor [Frederiksenia canicola]
MHFNKNKLTAAILVAASSSLYANQSATLDVVEVTAHSGTKYATDVITLEQRNRSTETDLRGLFQAEPSIEFGGGNGTSQFLTIRGMGQNSVDIKVDGASSDSQILYHQGRFIIDPSLLKSVSVQKGAGSASAGIGATNGAIVAKTVDALDLLKGSDRDFGFKVNGGYASNDGHSYGASVFGKAGNFDALLSFNRNDEDNYKAGKRYQNGLGGSRNVPYSALDKRNYMAKLGATFGDHRVVLSHLQDQHRGERLVREEFAAFSDNPRLTLARQSPSYRETTLSNTNLEYTGKNLGFVSELTANAYLMKNKRYSANDKGCGYCGNVDGPTTTVIETKGANLNLDSYIGENVLVKYGLNYRNQEVKPGAITGTFFKHNPEKTGTGVYVEAISGISDFTLTTGLRYDHFNYKASDGVQASGSKLNPSVGLIYQATPELSFSANHNYASRSPRLHDALMVGLEDRKVSISPTIKAEQARNTEIGFRYKNGGFSFDAGYFWQKVDDLIVSPQLKHDTQGKPIRGSGIAVNNGYSKNHGYELNTSYNYEGLTARLGVAYSKPRFYLNTADKSVNPEFAVQAGRTWTAGLAYRFDNPSLELGWKGRYVEDVNNISVVVGGDALNRASYVKHDFYVNWKPLNNDKLNINLALNNAFNKFYQPHSQKVTNTLPGVGRDFRVNVNYTF